MKKLICASDVESLHEENKRVISITENTIITPSAKDLAEEYDMTFKVERPRFDVSEMMTQDWSKESLVSLLRSLITDDALSPFILERDSSGVEIIKHHTIKLKDFPQKEHGVFVQELMHSSDGECCLECLSINPMHFIEQQVDDSFFYIIEGELKATLKESTICLEDGDIIHIPQNEVIDWDVTKQTTVLKIKMKGVLVDE